MNDKPRRTSPEKVHRILSAHFAANPHHFTSGRGGKTAVNAVQAATGLSVSTISEWADAHEQFLAGGDPTQFIERAKDRQKYAAALADLASSPQAFVAAPITNNTTTDPNETTTMNANAIPNDPTAEILPTDAEDSQASGAVDLASLAKGLAGIQQKLTSATTEIRKAREAEAKAQAAAQRVNETNKELAAKLADAESTIASLSKSQAAPLAVRTAHADDHSHVPTVDATHIPTGVDTEIDWALKHGSDLLITGPTGSGKTAPIIQACARAKRPMRRVCFDGETTSQDLIGRRDALEGKTVWTDGILPQAMEAGQVLLVDEIDRADESARAALFSVLDSRTMYLPVPNKRVVAAAGFQLIAACNGVGDNSGAYTGTQPIDAAFLGRWLDVVRVEYPNEQRECAMLMAHVPGINKAFVEKTCEFFKVLRKAETDGNLTGPFSIRQSKRLAQLYFMFKIEAPDVKVATARAATRTLIDRTTEDNRAIIRETFQRVYGFECKVGA